jgi:hypothetical protein
VRRLTGIDQRTPDQKEPAMARDDYSDLPDEPTALVHSLAAGRLGDTYSPSDYLRELEKVKETHPALFRRAYPSAAVEERRRYEQRLKIEGLL